MRNYNFLRTAYTELNQGQLTDSNVPKFAALQDNDFSGISTFQSRFGSWNKALDAAGITTTHKGPKYNYSDEELLDFLRTAYSELNQGKLTVSMYENYVHENDLPWPKESYLYKRLGKWSTCLEAAGIPSH